jgi:ATP-dependent RNA helicase RhlE
LSHSNDVPGNETPERLFSEFPFLPSIHADLVAAGFERPTPIQAAAIGPALEGHDIIGLAQTGTGKTAAFALPIIQRLAQRMELGALVLAPTRELAAQISGVFEQLGQSSGIRVATIVGGVSMDLDLKALKSWPNVLVATPGRLIDHIRLGTVNLAEIEVLVIDEADRMHDMGFIPQIQTIILRLPTNRQTLMFTATMDRDVEKVVRESMQNPMRIQIGQRGAPAQRAEQKLYAVREDDRTPLLIDLLRRSGDSRVLVFVRTKRGVDRLFRAVYSAGLPAVPIHGNREQSERDAAMAGFREGTYRILIATDIAARGIDVANIGHVINYDFPRHAEDYVHRIGRTARVEAKGMAISFVTRDDHRALAAVKKLIGDKLPAVEPSPRGGKSTDPLPAGLTSTGKAKRRRRRGGRGRSRRGGRRHHTGSHHHHGHGGQTPPAAPSAPTA